MKKLMIFHPTIAPYRIDFFNDLAKRFDTQIYLYYENLKSQTFDYEQIKKKFEFTPHYMKEMCSIGGRTLYWGHISEILKNQPDIVIVGEYSFGAWCATLARKFSCKKFTIVTICDDSVKIAEECRGFRRKSRHLLLKELDGIILGNESVQEWYQLYCNVSTFVFPIIHKDQVFREELSHTLSNSDALIKQMNLIGKKILLFVGRLVQEKNVEYLVRSFIQAHNHNREMVLFIVGDSGSSDGSVEKTCKELIKKMDAGNYIYMVGHKEEKELLMYFTTAQILILPSYYEPFGAVVNEALLAGEYVMVSENAGAASLVSNQNGEIIQINRPYIEFDKMLEKITPCEEHVRLRENLMPYAYDEKMQGLVQWLNRMSDK